MNIHELINRAWPNWKVIGELGSGSFGTVYQIEREDLVGTKEAAVKVIYIPQNEDELRGLRSEGVRDDEMRTYLEGRVRELGAEIRLMDMVRGNPNIVGIEDYMVLDFPEKPQYVVLIRMELLMPLLKRTEFPWNAAGCWPMKPAWLRKWTEYFRAVTV